MEQKVKDTKELTSWIALYSFWKAILVPHSSREKSTNYTDKAQQASSMLGAVAFEANEDTARADPREDYTLLSSSTWEF